MKLLLLLSSALMICSCNPKETGITEIAQEKHADSVGLSQTVDSTNLQTEAPQPVAEEQLYTAPGSTLKDLSGTHGLTLQWIDWEKWGSINFIKTEGNRYKVSGKQIKGTDYLKVEGEITQVSDIQLDFEGTIEHKAMGEEPCIRTGVQTFLATGKRQYWRLQNMEHCDGLTDYIDIYF